MTSRKVSIFYFKLYKKFVNAVCIIRERNIESNTVRPGAEPIDPRQLKIKSQNFTVSKQPNCT